jgi:hypothetical protein
MPPPSPLLLQPCVRMPGWGQTGRGEAGVLPVAGRNSGRPALAPPQGRHWKAGEFPGTVDGPKSRPAPSQGKRRPAESSPPQLSDRKKHWKVGEFPGTAAGSSSSKPSRAPLKNVKKKMDDRAEAKAWACTVTEALADRISSKNWQGALQVNTTQYISFPCLQCRFYRLTSHLISFLCLQCQC